VLRSLGLVAASSVAISNMIGQGVFLKARAMTCNVGSPGLMLAAWIVAGLLSLCGALTLGELGAAIPESGGIYAFLRRAYGGAVSFAYGWMLVFIASPASIAALGAGAAIFFNLSTGHLLDAVGFSTTLAGLPVAVSGTQIGALTLIVVMTAINCAPAIINGEIATASAVLKVGMLAAVTFGAFVFGHGDVAHFGTSGGGGSCAGIAESLRGGAAGFAAALIGALYAYNGWHSLTLVAGEVKQPGRTLPLALSVSVMLVVVLYVAGNASFVYLLGPLQIANLAPSASVGVAVVDALVGPLGRIIAAAFLFASVAATLHVTILTNARVTYALAQDVVGNTVLGRVSARGHVPVNAVLLNSVIASALVLAGTFDTLSNYFIFNNWVFFVAAGTAMFVLRRREPALVRPYRTFGDPVVPAVYVLVGAWLVIETAITTPLASAIGLAIVAVSFPVYYLQRRRA
jgi:APA family basic amino acid/polyamine antiporter